MDHVGMFGRDGEQFFEKACKGKPCTQDEETREALAVRLEKAAQRIREAEDVPFTCALMEDLPYEDIEEGIRSTGVYSLRLQVVVHYTPGTVEEGSA